MAKIKGKSLHEILKKQLKRKEFRLLFDEKRFYLQIAHLVSGLRAKAGFSQAEVAKRTGVSQPMIARLEKGDHRRTPTFDTIYKILNALGYTLVINVKPTRKKAA